MKEIKERRFAPYLVGDRVMGESPEQFARNMDGRRLVRQHRLSFKGLRRR